MDWIEECVEKYRQYVKNASMRRAAAVYFLIAVLGSLACTNLTVNLTSLWINVMEERIPPSDLVISVLGFVRMSCPYFYMVAAFFLAGGLYTKNKVEDALLEVGMAVKSMAAGDLSFEIAWQSKDEFGELVKDLEGLRETLKKDKLNQWRMGDTQREINAAFAHDIRTPLTVMNGYTEFLMKYVPQGKVTQQMLLEKLERISCQGDRLLAFSKTMTTLQTMEKREVRCRRKKTAEICSRMKEAAEEMKREGQQIVFTDHTEGRATALADLDLILEAVENVLQNAFRYAVEKVEVMVQYQKNKLMVFVKDDGEGFSEKALREADTVYFRERKEGEEDGHFGIGLSIAKMLCESHGGELSCHNSIEGGAVVAVSFFVGETGA